MGSSEGIRIGSIGTGEYSGGNIGSGSGTINAKDAVSRSNDGHSNVRKSYFYDDSSTDDESMDDNDYANSTMRETSYEEDEYSSEEER